MTTRLLPVALLAASLVACVEAHGRGAAGECAEVVRLFKGLQEPVAVVGRPLETSEGSVEIDYEGLEGMNLPARGSARCTFAVGEAGELTLLEASVDGSPLPPADLDSIRAQLGR